MRFFEICNDAAEEKITLCITDAGGGEKEAREMIECIEFEENAGAWGQVAVWESSETAPYYDQRCTRAYQVEQAQRQARQMIARAQAVLAIKA